MNIVRIIKKNTSIIIPAVMAAVALLLLVPTIMIRGKISSKLEESVKLGREVTSSLRNAVSDKQYEIVRKLEDMHQTDANEIENLAKQTSQRELFSYKIFPEPNETSVQIFNEFRKAYMTAFAKLTTDMRALDAPTDVEIRKEAGSVEIPTDTYTRETISSSPTEDKSDEIIKLLCKRRSEEVPVYANPRVFSGYAVWDNWEYSGTESAVRNCWYSQLAYWIHKDIVDTINTMNSGFTSTTKSSVKRLLGVRFARSGATSADVDNKGRELPAYVTDKGGGLCLSWTGRKCGDLLDVVHFDLAVIVKADDVLKFMEELCSEKEHSFAGYKGDLKPEKYKHNQITILQSNIEPVYRDSPEHKRYYYGQDAVVLMNLVCEYVFNRQGYDIIKPKYIQNDIAGTAGAVQQQSQPGVSQPSGVASPQMKDE